MYFVYNSNSINFPLKSAVVTHDIVPANSYQKLFVGQTLGLSDRAVLALEGAARCSSVTPTLLTMSSIYKHRALNIAFFNINVSYKSFFRVVHFFLGGGESVIFLFVNHHRSFEIIFFLLQI